MSKLSELEKYLAELREHLGHVNRHQNFCDYLKGLLLVEGRKSVEPMAAALDPLNTRSRHQALHHFVADSPWSDQKILDKAWQWVDSRIPSSEQRYLIIDDTGIPKKGLHSVGVSHQYCGQLGKSTNCQVAVSVSLASKQASIPVAWQLYLPKEWTADQKRCRSVGVPSDIRFATKTQIAMAQLRQCCERGIPQGTVLADAAYGSDHAFREGLEELNLDYIVGIKSNSGVWALGKLPIKPMTTKGKRSVRFQYTDGHRPDSVKDIAMSLPDDAWKYIEWRDGTNGKLNGWFSALRVRISHRDHTRKTLRDEQWLLVEWPENEPKPTRYWLSNLPASQSIKQLVYAAKTRWHIERDYQELKDELGLNHYEGRNWRGFHHHATLCIAAYAYLVAQRIEKTNSTKKNAPKRKKLTVPKDYIARGSPEITAAC